MTCAGDAHDAIVPAAEIAARAAAVVGSRAQAYGDVLDLHTKIAAMWNGILAAAGKSPVTPLDAHDVANLMEGLKIARRYLGAFNLDDYVDGAGYAACAGEIAQALAREVIAHSTIGWAGDTERLAE